jgi:hypothetical protein
MLPLRVSSSSGAARGARPGSASLSSLPAAPRSPLRAGVSSQQPHEMMASSSDRSVRAAAASASAGGSAAGSGYDVAAADAPGLTPAQVAQFHRDGAARQSGLADGSTARGAAGTERVAQSLPQRRQPPASGARRPPLLQTIAPLPPAAVPAPS